MLIEEEELKAPGEVNLDAVEEAFADELSAGEELDVVVFGTDDERVDEIDIAFQANDEGYW